MRAKRTSGLSSKTVCNQLNFLHGVFAFAIKHGWATSNPVALVDRPRTPRHAHRRLRFLQREELDALLRAVPDDELGAVERPLYLCAAMTGLRQGELIALRWTDVDWVASRVRVAESYTRGAFDSPKSHRGRSVPMADRLAGELELHFQRSRFQADEDLVFAHPVTGHVLDASKLPSASMRHRSRRAASAHIPRAAPEGSPGPRTESRDDRHNIVRTQRQWRGVRRRRIYRRPGYADDHNRRERRDFHVAGPANDRLDRDVETVANGIESCPRYTEARVSPGGFQLWEMSAVSYATGNAEASRRASVSIAVASSGPSALRRLASALR